ncbi:hypothetical protein CALCODRAFT_484759 [Calocera cornea HHB12733]|uniref:Transmembrane protein n=1 Tax=Calocera cornea HHB12733 TaxID=1353952 RepID=A0A165ETG8_9BASI|nr:hypothetical protein CALCODRAFT_484759 [Calocera cornea HHB12733]
MSGSGWKPAPADPYWSLPESQGGPSRAPPSGRPGRPFPRPSLPQQAPPPSPLASKLSLWGTVIFIPLSIYYTVFVADYGDQEHIYSPARRWLKEQKEAFFTLTPGQRRLAGVTQPASEPTPAFATADATPVDFTSAAPVVAEPPKEKESSWWWIRKTAPEAMSPDTRLPVEPPRPLHVAPGLQPMEPETAAPEPMPMDMEKLKERVGKRWWGFK